MWIKILLIFFVFSFLFRTDSSFDQDLGRHIKLGEIIIKTLQVPKINLFSYTSPDFPFINTHWLFEAFVYIFAQANLLYFLLVLKVAIIISSVWLILQSIPRQYAGMLLPIGFIFLHILRERLELRPEIFSFLFTASTYFILERFLKEKTRLIFLLPLTQLLWVNTHIYFFVGLILQAIFLSHSLGVYLFHPRGVGGIHLRILAIIFISSILLSLINPNGLAGLLYPLNVTKNYGYTIVENQNMQFLENLHFRNPNFLFVKISLTIITISLIFALLKRRLTMLNVLIALFGATFAMINVRSFPYLIFLSLPAVLQNFGDLGSGRFARIAFFPIAIILLLESFFYLNGYYYRIRDLPYETGLGYSESVKNAMDFVISKKLPEPVYNNFDIGSYIIYRGYPKYKVFVDGRPEAYPAQFFTGIYIPSQSDYKNFQRLEEIYKFRTIIFSYTDQTPWAKHFLSELQKDGNWKVVYIDDFMIVFVNETSLADINLHPIDLSELNPNLFKFKNHVSYLRMGLYLLGNQHQNGIQFVQASLQIFPQSPVARSILGHPSSNIFFW